MINWTITAPDDIAFTSEELAAVGRAVQAFLASLQASMPYSVSLVSLDNVGVLNEAAFPAPSPAPATAQALKLIAETEPAKP